MSQDAFKQSLHRRLPRMLAAGVDYNDAMTVASQASGLTDWTTLWSQMARVHETLGDSAAREGNFVSAGEQAKIPHITGCIEARRRYLRLREAIPAVGPNSNLQRGLVCDGPLLGE